MSLKNTLSPYGYHRVLDPIGALPQSAQRLSSSPILQDEFEMSLDVDSLLLDATSMRQLRESAGGDPLKIAEEIQRIVQERGKLHNPVTHSGGVMVGRIREVGSRFFSIHPKQVGGDLVGQVIVPVASLSTLPLRITQVKRIVGDRVDIEGQAILFACMRVCPVPAGMSAGLTLTCVDISSLVPQVRRCLEEVLEKRRTRSAEMDSTLRVLVMGCGKAGVTALYCLKNLATRLQFNTGQGPRLQVLAIDAKPDQVDWVRKQGLVDEAAVIDASRAEEVYEFVSSHAGPHLCDLIIQVVNVPGTETATVLCARSRGPRGTILWFSMATRFDQVALATDSLGKDVTMIIGNGVADGQVEEIVALVRGYPALKTFLDA